MDIMGRISQMTSARVTVGPGTLYNLLEQFLSAGMICETKVVGRRRSYILTEKGASMLQEEYNRLNILRADYERIVGKGELKWEK